MWKLDVFRFRLQDQMHSNFQLWYCTTSRPLPTVLVTLVSSWTTKLSRKTLSSYLKAQSHLSNNLVTSHICHSCLLTGLKGKLVTSIHRSCSDVPLWSSFIIIILRWYLWFSGKIHQDNCQGAFTNYVCTQGWVGGQKNEQFTSKKCKVGTYVVKKYQKLQT